MTNSHRRANKNKKKKQPADVGVCRLRSASKILSQQRFTKAMIADAAKKFTMWTDADLTKHIYEDAVKLRGDGVAEKSLGNKDLGDNLSAVRLTYTILERWELLLIVSVGSSAIEEGTFTRADGKKEAWHFSFSCNQSPDLTRPYSFQLVP